VPDREHHVKADMNDRLRRDGADALRDHLDTAETVRPRIRLIAFADLKPGIEPEYLVVGLIPRRGLTVVWGPPKSGKSFWVTDLMLHVALGREYRGRAVQPGGVIYCAFEGVAGYGKRAEAFRLRHLSEHVGEVPFHLVAQPLSFAREHQELIAAIRRTLGFNVKPAAVVLDTLNRSLAGSENDDEAMTAYIRAADAIRAAFRCAVVIIHHCGVDGSRPRGHTSLTGAVDAQLAVKRDTAGNVIVEVEWMKDGSEDGAKVASRLESVEVATDSTGQPITSCVVVPADDMPATKPAKPARMPKAAATALRALGEAIGELGEVPPASNHIPPATKAVTLAQWRDYTYRRGISTSERPRANQLAFQRAADHLISIEAVAVWDPYAWIVRESH
jgi:hypothetical protein